MDTYHGQQLVFGLYGMRFVGCLSLSAPIDDNTARSSGYR